MLHALAHARAGDKGNRLNIGLFALNPAHYPHLAAEVTEARVMALFAHRGCTKVVRHDLPRLAGFNFVLDDVLEGGVNGALNLDGHGKTLSFLLLGMKVAAPAG
jgi:hypothetical protein